jgi:hypothetical protein
MCFTNSLGRKLQDEELHSLYRSPNIVRAIKSRRLKWSEYVANHTAKLALLLFYIFLN